MKVQVLSLVAMFVATVAAPSFAQENACRIRTVT